MGHLLWYCYGQHSHTLVRRLKHAAHLYTHNWVKWNRVCLGVCYVTTSVVHCFLCPASFACLTAARVQCRWIMWRVSVRYNVLWKHPKVMRNRYDSSIILVFVSTAFRRLWCRLDKAFPEKALKFKLIDIISFKYFNIYTVAASEITYFPTIVKTEKSSVQKSNQSKGLCQVYWT